MNPSPFIAAALSLILLSPGATSADDQSGACRRAALDLAGAWANDGFRLRDSSWSGTLTPGKPSIVRVSLLAGNSYWFTAAAASAAGKISVTLYDENGQPVPAQNYSEGLRAAARFEPSASGSYFVKTEAAQPAAAPFCLVYFYI